MNLDAAVEQPVAVVVPPVVETESLADHEATYSPEARAEAATEPTAEVDATPVQRTRHRAKSQQASSEDVPRIRELTAKLREAEERAARYEAQSRQPSTGSPSPVHTVVPATAAPTGAVVPPTRPEPSEDEVGTKYQTYGAFTRDLAKWDREQEQAAERIAADATKGQEGFQRAIQSYDEQEREYITAHPDYPARLVEVFQSFGAGFRLSPIVHAVLLTKGPSFTDHLLTHPDQLAEMQVLFEGKPANDTSVALATRWLSSRVQAVPTGSAAPTPPVTPAPRPPNPVRTGPMKTGDELPGDDSSLDAHQKAFGKKLNR